MAYYIADIIVAVGVLVATLACGKKGFISCLFGIVTTLVALILAIALSKAVLSGTDGLFGLQSALSGKFEKTFLKIDGFSVDVSTVGVDAALKSEDVTAILVRLVMKTVGKAQNVPAGTTLASLLGDATGKLAATLIVGILIFIAVKLLSKLLKKVLNGVADSAPLISGVNSLLGAIFGFLYALLIVCVVLAVFAVLPIQTVQTYISKTLFIKILYEHNLLVYLLSLFI